MSDWLAGVEFNAPLDTVQVISESVFTANHLTETDKHQIFAADVGLHKNNSKTSDGRTHAQTDEQPENITPLAPSIGNESVPKIIINDTIIFFLKLQSAFW